MDETVTGADIGAWFLLGVEPSDRALYGWNGHLVAGIKKKLEDVAEADKFQRDQERAA